MRLPVDEFVKVKAFYFLHLLPHLRSVLYVNNSKTLNYIIMQSIESISFVKTFMVGLAGSALSHVVVVFSFPDRRR